MQHQQYGSKVPYAEPSWYRGIPTPYYTKEHALFRDRVRKWVEAEVMPHVDEWDEQGDFPFEDLRKSAHAAGLLSPWMPAELGGTPPEGGWDDFMFLIWIHEFGRCGCTGVTITFFVTVMSLPHIIHFGSDLLKETIAKPIAAGEQCMAITLTEPQGGSDLANIKTTATLSSCGKYYIVNGQKKFITNGLKADWLSTLVRTGDKGLKGLSVLTIPAKAEGVKISKIVTSGWWAGNTTLITFDDVKVPVEYLVGQEGMGFIIMATAMNGERLIGCQGAVSGARLLLREAIEFARERKTFGQKLISHQVIRHKIARMAQKVESAQAHVESLVYSMKMGAGPADIGGPMALLKVECTSALEYCAREASQILGGNAFQRSGKGRLVERLSREVRVMVVGGGSEEVMLDLSARMSGL